MSPRCRSRTDEDWRARAGDIAQELIITASLVVGLSIFFSSPTSC